MAGAAGRADLADDGEDDVFRGDAVMELAVDGDAHVLGFPLDQRLRRQNVLDLGRADAMRQRAEGAMRRGVAVAADDGHAGQGEALLGADDVDDALPVIELIVIFDAEMRGVVGERLHLDRRFRVGDALRTVGGRHIVIDHGQRPLRRMHRAAGEAQTLKGLRRRHFMDKMPVNVEEGGAVFGLVHKMLGPNLVIESLTGHGRHNVANG